MPEKASAGFFANISQLLLATTEGFTALQKIKMEIKNHSISSEHRILTSGVIGK